MGEEVSDVWDYDFVTRGIRVGAYGAMNGDLTCVVG